MKKILFSLFIILLVAVALFYKKTAEDLSDLTSVLVSYIVQNPTAAEVFSLNDSAAVET